MADSPQRWNRLHQLVRDFALQTPIWAAAIRVRTTPSEARDLTAVAARVYGDRSQWPVIQAAAGLDSPELLLPEMDLVLPTPAQLVVLKARAGFAGAALE